jgi:hypothetical protein
MPAEDVMKIIISGTLIAILWLLIDSKLEKAHAEGFTVGMRYALNTSQPSNELESACLNLWATQQNKKYMEKNKWKLSTSW